MGNGDDINGIGNRCRFLNPSSYKADCDIEERSRIYADLIKSLIEQRISGMDRAAVLKASEIDRRLEEHNELRKEVLEDRESFVRKNIYAEHTKAQDLWKVEVNDAITKLMTQYQSRMSTANYISLGAMVIALINVVILILVFATKNPA